MSKKQVLLLFVGTLLLTACGSGAATPTPSPAALSPTPKPSDTPSYTPTPIPATPTHPALVEPLRSDLALRLGIAQDQIEVAGIEKTVWPDASLDCPEPGRMYAQVITPGYLVRLQVQDEVYEYHSAAGGSFVLCQGGRPASEPSTIGSEERMSAEADHLVEKAKKQAADKFDLSLEEILLHSIVEKEWPDSSLGCPHPGESYMQQVTPGYQITLAAEKHFFVFHTDKKDRVILCQSDEPYNIYSEP